jgi:hypothetical protein
VQPRPVTPRVHYSSTADNSYCNTAKNKLGLGGAEQSQHKHQHKQQHHSVKEGLLLGDRQHTDSHNVTDNANCSQT